MLKQRVDHPEDRGLAARFSHGAPISFGLPASGPFLVYPAKRAKTAASCTLCESAHFRRAGGRLRGSVARHAFGPPRRRSEAPGVPEALRGSVRPSWVHFARNVLPLVPKTHKDMVAPVFRTTSPNPTPPSGTARPTRRSLPPDRATGG
jgi:hypothetical protein